MAIELTFVNFTYDVHIWCRSNATAHSYMCTHMYTFMYESVYMCAILPGCSNVTATHVLQLMCDTEIHIYTCVAVSKCTWTMPVFGSLAACTHTHTHGEWTSHCNTLYPTLQQLQHTATHCSALHAGVWVAGCVHTHEKDIHMKTKCVTATHCNTLQHAATRCNTAPI